MWCDPTVLSAAALSWRHWTPLRRCGCQSGNMKTTEHVPSTGRPFSRGQNSPRTVLEPPPAVVGDSCPCHVRVPLRHQLPVSLLLFFSHFRNSHFGVCQFPWQLPFLSPSFPCCRTTSPCHSSPKNTCRGPSGCVRGQWLALWTLTGHASLISPQWSIGFAL